MTAGDAHPTRHTPFDTTPERLEIVYITRRHTDDATRELDQHPDRPTRRTVSELTDDELARLYDALQAAWQQQEYWRSVAYRLGWQQEDQHKQENT